MTPAARLQAAIEVLDRIASSRQPADQALKAWGARSRYAGAKDRKAVADRVYACLREHGGQASGRRMVLAALAEGDGVCVTDIAELFSGQGHAPAALSPDERVWLEGLGTQEPRLPPFIEDELERAFGDDWLEELGDLLKSRAPLCIRVNMLKADIHEVAEAVFEHGYPFEAGRMSAVGLRVQPGADLQALDLFAAGAFEIQDEGSQAAAWLAGARPGETVVDYCAGGGGKTLALAAAMAGRGRLIACDINAKRLDSIRPRLARAGVMAELRALGDDALQDLQGQVDRVLVDAPCSGSGTWRRRPEEAWRLKADALDALGAVQAEVLAKAAALVRPGGRLTYVTCSVLPCENVDVAAAFAGAHPGFRPLAIDQAAGETPLLTDAGRARLAELSAGGHTVQLSPRRTGTDGFFIALFERIS